MSRAMLFSGLMAITYGPTLLAQTQPVSAVPSRSASGPAAPRIEFEVASIKPDLEGSGDFSWDTPSNGHVTIRNLDVYNLIRGAFGLRDLQMSGGPAWIKNRRYDIQAQPAQSATPVPREQVNRMVQALLEDRFQLKWHRETRDAPAYALTIGPHGAKLPPPREGRGRPRMGDLDMPSMSLDQLCQTMEFELGRTVLNRTGQSGQFAIQLQYDSERAPAANRDASRPSLFTAVQEQLGLKLESIRAPLEMFVIDNVEAPSEN